MLYTYLYTYKRTEDDYWNARADRLERIEREAMESAEMAADLWEFDSDEEREKYIDEYFAAEYERLCREYEKTL